MADVTGEWVELGVPGDRVRVRRIGLGTMGLTSAYGAADADSSLALLQHAADVGCTFWDTADVYGSGANERLVGRALAGRARDAVFVCTKFGVSFEEGNEAAATGVCGEPAYVRRAVEASLRRLGVARIDLL
ncbi:hypothetical protein GGI04_005484, partial [Coemansia thaxteri]